MAKQAYNTRTIEDLELKLNLFACFDATAKGGHQIFIMPSLTKEAVSKMSVLRAAATCEEAPEMMLTIGQGDQRDFSRAKGVVRNGGRVGVKYKGQMRAIWEPA